ncbi:MAG: protein kinase [Polyangia bacterium]
MAEFSCPNCGTENPNDALYCSACGHPLHQTASDPLIGQTIGGRYYLVERIGQGSAGTLYRAEHTTLRRRVAIKLLHKQLTASEDAIERFRREAITVCEIDNDHIPQVHDFGRTDDGRLFFAMEFLDGETLSQVLVRESRLSPERTADLLGQIADGLMEAHTLGYVHRDLRPRSIFLTRRRGRQDFVKILDFGLAKLVQPEVDAQRTTMGMTYGDPRYMAPEQARGEAVDRRSDIYSLGVIGFECLTGEPPYKGGGHFEILNQILDAPVPRLRDRRPDCPAWLESVVRTALAKKPSERFQTVAQLLDALERKQVLQGQPPMPMQVAAPVASKLPAMSPLSTTLKPQPLTPAAKPAASSPAVPPVAPDPVRSTQALPTVAPGTPAQPAGGVPAAAVPSARQTLAYPAVKPTRSAPVEPAPGTRSTTPLGSSGFNEPLPAKKPAAVAAKPAVAKPAPIIAATTPVRADPTPRTARAILEREMNAWEEAALPVLGSDEPATPPSADTPVEEHRFEAKPAPAPVPAAGRLGGTTRPASSRREISRIEARENRPISTPAIAAMRGLMSSPGLAPVGRSEPEVRSPSRPEPVPEPAPASPSEPSSPRLKPLPTEDSGRATIPFERPSLSDLAVKVQASRQTPVPEQPPERAPDKSSDKSSDKSGERKTEPLRADLSTDVPLRPALAGSPQLAQLGKRTAEIAVDTQPVQRSEPGDVTVPTPRSEPAIATDTTAVTPKISAATAAVTVPTATITGEHDSEKTPETPPDEANWFAAQAPTGDTYAEDEESLRPRRLPRWAVPAGLAAAAIGVVWLVTSSTGTKKPHEGGSIPTVTAPESTPPTAPSAPAMPTAPPASATPTSTGVQPAAPAPSTPTVEALPGSPAASPTAPVSPKPEVTPLPATSATAKPSTPAEARPVPTVEALPSPTRPEPAKPEPAKPEPTKPEVAKPEPAKAAEPKAAVAKKTEEPKAEPKAGKKGKGKGEPGTKVATAKEPGDAGAGALKSLDEPAAGAKAEKSSEVTALVQKGKQKLDDGDPDAAAASFERAAALDPKNAEAVGGLGEAAFEQGSFEAAARHLGRAAKLSRRASYRELLAQAQFKLGRYKEAAETCRGLLKDNPGSAKAKQILELAEKKLGSE